MPQQTIAILDFGSQYVQLIARRVRENHVHSLLFAPGVSPDELRRHDVIGVILSGGPASAYAESAPQPHPRLLDLDVPMLGICYGMQAACRMLGAAVEPAGRREYGRTKLEVIEQAAGTEARPTVWHRHPAGEDAGKFPVPQALPPAQKVWHRLIAGGPAGGTPVPQELNRGKMPVPQQKGAPQSGAGVPARQSSTHVPAASEAPDPLLRHLPKETTVWMSHGDVVSGFGDEFLILARTRNCPGAIVRHKARPFYGVQFHPEVTHTPEGGQILRNFLYEICGADGSWRAGAIADNLIAQIRRQVHGDSQVICGLSGGVDSSVTAALLHLALPDRVACIFVDIGLLRERERDRVEAVFRGHFKVDLHVVDAADRFLDRLAGVTDPQEKRRRIGHTFVEVFKQEARRIPNAHYLAQGTLYPDVIESGHSAAGAAAGIKLHHNVGGLPAELGFELIEPLRDLFKDEVRVIGELLGLPEEIVWRHPFPGPGLAVRIIGEVTRPRLELLRQADAIIIEELTAAGWYRKVAQAFGVLLPVSSVGVMGDGRTYADQHVVVIRLVESTDFMTADWVHIDPTVLAAISTRITNEVPGVNRVVYDVTSKPPGTIEWE